MNSSVGISFLENCMHFLYVVVEVWKSVREDTILAENVVSATVWRDLIIF